MSRTRLSIPAIAVAGLLLAPMTALSGPAPSGPATPFDFNKDTKTDLSSFNTSTFVVRTNMIDGVTAIPPVGFPTTLSATLQLVGAASVDGSGQAQLVALNSSTGLIRIISLDAAGTTATGSHFPASVNGGFKYVGAGDFDGNGTDDLLFYQTTGPNTGLMRVILMNSDFTVKASGFPATLPSGFVPFGVGDVNGDGHADIAAAQTTGPNQGLYRFFIMNTDGLTVSSSTFPGSAAAGAVPVGLGYLDSDTRADVLSVKKVDPNKGLARVQVTGSGGTSFTASSFPFTVTAGMVVTQIGSNGGPGEVFTTKTADPNGGTTRVFILSSDASTVSTTGFPVQIPLAFTVVGNVVPNQP